MSQPAKAPNLYVQYSVYKGENCLTCACLRALVLPGMLLHALSETEGPANEESMLSSRSSLLILLFA